MKLNTRIAVASLFGAVLFILLAPSSSSGNRIVPIFLGVLGAIIGSLFAGREMVPNSLRSFTALMLSKICAFIVSSDNALIGGCFGSMFVSLVFGSLNFTSVFIGLGFIGNIYLFSKIALKFLPDPNTKVQLVSSYE